MGPIHWTILSSVLFAAAVQSLAFPGPNPTFEVVVPLNAQSPRTTDPPAVPEILRRQNGLNSTQTVIYATDNTCGFMSGRLGAALSCYSTRSCFFFPSLGLRGCCDGDDCGFAVACRDMEEASISKYCDNGCLMDTLTVKCTDTSYPYCNTALYLGGITDYFCNSLNVSSPQIVETTYRGQTDRTLITTVVDLATLTTTTTKPPIILSESDTTTSSSSPSPPSSLSKPAPPSQSPSPTSVPQESSTPIAPIVGGVVGGVAVIGLIVLGIIFLVKKGGSKPPPPAPTPGPTDPSSPIGFSATPMGGSPLPQQVQQQQTPPPADVKYGQSEPMVQAYPAVVPPTQGYQQQPQQYQQQQQQYSPQGSTGVGYFVSSVPSQQQYQQPSPTDPNNRLSTASPASPTSNSDSPQEQRHFSQQSFASNSTYPNIQAYQQQGAGAAQGNTGYQYAPPQPPPNVYEAGGHVVGGPPDLNADHRGQIYQLQ